MHKQTIALLFGAVLLLGGAALVVPQLLGDDAAPTVHWSTHDEVEVAGGDATRETGDVGQENLDRSAVELTGPGALADAGERVEATLSGRVVDRFGAPIRDAKVWLDFGRGGRGGPQARQRRVPDPVVTGAEGRFAFQGQTFRSLRVSMQVAHSTHAPGVFDKDLGEIGAQVDLGDLVLTAGGEVIGRVTDLEGNGVAGAVLELQPDNRNPMRMLRDRANLLPPFTTDTNGFYRKPNVTAGEWSLTAIAKMHTEGRSAVFAVEDEQQAQVDDIRLGPGYELAGYVRDAQGKGIAEANVAARSQTGGGGGGGQQGPGRGGPRMAFGRDHSTRTDKDGHFFLEHLPVGPLTLDVTAEAYLDLRQDDVDPKLGQVLQLTLADGLRITGRVTEADGAPVVMYAVRATRVRGLPMPGMENIDIADLMTKMRDNTLDEATRTQLRTQMESLRSQFGNQRRTRGPDNAPPDQAGGRGNRDLGKAERHPDGVFSAGGLQEGVYQVLVQSDDHARYRSAEIEVRLGAPAPDLTIALDGGVFVSGSVLDDTGAPVANAQVELRPDTGDQTQGRRRNQNGAAANGGNNNGQPDWQAMGRNFMAQMQADQGTLDAKTDNEGSFVIKHVARGTYSLRAQANGFAEGSSDAFELASDTSGKELRLGALGSIAGQVGGLRGEDFAQAHVAAVPIGNDGGGGGLGGLGAMFGRGRGPGGGGGPFQQAQVAADGSYRIDNLTPGNYLVRSWLGSGQDLMRELMPQMLSGELAADIAVRAREVAKLDLAVTRPQVGIVAGTLIENGNPATGYQIELSKLDETGNAGGGGGPGGGGRGRMFGGFGNNFQGTVASTGHFKIDSVPAGSYRLRVQSGRRGGTMHEETVQVATDMTTEVQILLMTQAIKGTVSAEDGAAPADLDGRISLLPGLTALPDDYQAWQRQNQTFDARVQDGVFTFDAVKAGNYLLVLSVRGRERTTLPIVVGAGATLEVPVVAGKLQAPTTDGGGAPAANGGSGPGGGGPGSGGPGSNGPGGNGPGGSAPGQGGRRRGGNRGGNGGTPGGNGGGQPGGG